MRILWALFKVMLALALVIPVGLFVLAVTGVIVGTVIGLAVMALRLAAIGFAGYCVYRAARFFLGSSRSPSAPVIRELRPVDPYYEKAMRELDSELGPTSR